MRISCNKCLYLKGEIVALYDCSFSKQQVKTVLWFKELAIVSREVSIIWVLTLIMKKYELKALNYF
jgi:hypothetical protein